MPSSYRRVVFTLNNYTNEILTSICNYAESNCRYAIIAKEVAPTTGTPHLQGFLHFKNPKTHKTLGKVLPGGHFLHAKGSDEDSQVYCSKEDPSPWEFGTMCHQGKRSDLDDAILTLNESGGDLKRVAMEHAGAYVRYHRGFAAYKSLVCATAPRDFKTKLVVLFGPPGTGKTRAAYELAGENPYPKPRGEWWDGYCGNNGVIIDDFYGWLKFDELLKISDRYPYRVPIKGGYENFCTKIIIITSNIDISKWYKFDGYDPSALYRRCTKYLRCEKDVFCSMEDDYLVKINY